MKVFAVALLFAIVAYASAVVIPEVEYGGMIELDDGKIINLQDVDPDEELSTSTELPPIRHRRNACDIQPFVQLWTALRYDACDRGCYRRGYGSGTCKRGVCRCRRKMIHISSPDAL